MFWMVHPTTELYETEFKGLAQGHINNEFWEQV